MVEPRENTLKIHDLLKKSIYLSVPKAAQETGLSSPTVRSAVDRLQDLEIVREVTGKQRDKVYVYEEYLNILSEGIDPDTRVD